MTVVNLETNTDPVFHEIKEILISAGGLTSAKAVSLKAPESQSAYLSVLSDEVTPSILALAFSKQRNFRLYTNKLSEKGPDYRGNNWISQDGVAYLINPYCEKSMNDAIQWYEKNNLKVKGWGVLPIDLFDGQYTYHDDGLDKLEVDRRIKEIFAMAISQKASDIHIDPTASQAIVKLRVDGNCNPSPIVIKNHSEYKDIANVLLTKSGKNSGDFGTLHDGAFLWKLDSGRQLKIRVSCIPSKISTEILPKFTLRLLGQDSNLSDLDMLNLSREHVDAFKNISRRPHGLVLVTGPTGSGKSTTLYALLRHLHKQQPERSVYTIEDPVEQEVKGFTQLEVNNKMNITFASALRSLMRSDPDVILVGEIRDNETAELAVSAALTGHLVFATLHTNSACEAIPRMFDLGVDPSLVASTLIAVSAQRVVPKVCPECCTFINFIELPDAKVRYTGLKHMQNMYKDVPVEGEGCDKCKGKAFLGRTLINELLVMDSIIAGMITNRSSSIEIENYATSKDFLTLWEDAMRVLSNGKTTLSKLESSLGPRSNYGTSYRHSTETEKL